MYFYSQCQKAAKYKDLSLQLFNDKSVKYLMFPEFNLYYIIRFITIDCILPTFIFFYAFTLGLRDANSNFKVREIIQNFIKRLF